MSKYTVLSRSAIFLRGENPAVSGGDAKAVLAIVSRLNVLGLNLWYFEGAEADKGTELDEDVATVAAGGASKLFDFVVGEPDGNRPRFSSLPVACRLLITQQAADTIGPVD